ncbi:unnamed protein product [Ambrosiozyma monospora]|uniref:Unnamed protein product n=1 Tax=Ambrosiozyma monospora TaxID=43982 RepID=A0A9W7DDI5_AMBMO|nr:unnamed protein product [Ambrosiozyma monospora]
MGKCRIISQVLWRCMHYLPVNFNGTSPTFGQFYFIDGGNATRFRHSHPANQGLNPDLLFSLDEIFRDINQLVRASLSNMDLALQPGFTMANVLLSDEANVDQ